MYWNDGTASSCVHLYNLPTTFVYDPKLQWTMSFQDQNIFGKKNIKTKRYFKHIT